MAATKKHVTVLGAGVCGLAAAWELRRAGIAERVTILEASDRPGGMARSIRDPLGFEADLGPHRIHTELPEIEALLTDLLGEEMRWIKRRSAMCVEGQLVRYPFSVVGVLRLFGPLEFVRMGLSAVWAKISALWSPRPRHFAEHMRRAFGARVYERVLASYARKVWKRPGEEISVEAAKVRVSAGSMARLARRILTAGRERAGRETALRRFRYLRGGVEGLVTRLVAEVEKVGVEIRCDCPAEAAVCEGPRCWRVRHGGGEIETEGVISTVPLPTLFDLLEGPLATQAPRVALSQLEYLAIHLVYLTIARPQVSDNHWLYFPDADVCFNRGYEPKQFWAPPDAPADQTLLCLEITARPGTDLHRADDATLEAMVRRDLVGVGLAREEEIKKSVVVRLPFGYPLYDCTADTNMRCVLDHLRGWPDLVTTGRQGLFSHNNMDHSMHMGLAAARAIAAGPAGIVRWCDNAETMRRFRIVD